MRLARVEVQSIREFEKKCPVHWILHFEEMSIQQMGLVPPLFGVPFRNSNLWITAHLGCPRKDILTNCTLWGAQV